MAHRHRHRAARLSHRGLDAPGYDWQTERAANEFAAELLMPREMVLAEFEGSPDTHRLAKRFKVSELAMGYRLVSLGLR